MTRTNLATCLAVGVAVCCGGWCHAADHGDAPVLTQIMRSDARITDLYAFSKGDQLVLALCTNPAIPQGVESYLFPSDLELTFSINRHSRVNFSDLEDLEQFGGTIEVPASVVSDVTITVGFDADGAPQLKATGLARKDRDQIRIFAGLRDDPFIRRPREGRNVAAVVIELPLNAIARRNDVLLIWGSSEFPGPVGASGERAGRALRSMFDDALNMLSPQMQALLLATTPDVIIFDPALPAVFPNGRALEDDVVDLVVDIPGGTLPGEGPTFPTTNDVPFSTNFPYLADPH